MPKLSLDLTRSFRLCTLAAALLCASVGISHGECSPAVQPAFSTINSMLMLVGKNSAGIPDNQGLWVATFRSSTNAPIVGALVQIKWDQGTGPGGYNYSVCNTQTYPGVTYSKVGLTHIFSTTTDNTGSVSANDLSFLLTIYGAGGSSSGCP